MTNPLISIIIPVYNVEHFLETCLNSVVAQTYLNWEAICVNDGSTDNSLSILEKYAEKDPRFAIINQNNHGVSYARNVGMKQSKGEYLYFMDADDVMSSYFFELAADIIKKESPDCLCCDYIETKENDYAFRRPVSLNSFNISAPLAELIKPKSRVSHSLWTKIYKKESIANLEFATDIVYSEDLYFNILAFHQIKKLIFLDEKLYAYIRREGSVTISNFSEKKAFGLLMTCRKIHEKFSSCDSFSELRQNISDLILKFVMKKTEKLEGVKDKIYAEVLALKKCGAVSYRKLSLKMKFRLWKNARKLKLLCREK